MTNFELFIRSIIFGAGFIAGAFGTMIISFIAIVVIGGIFQEEKEK